VNSAPVFGAGDGGSAAPWSYVADLCTTGNKISLSQRSGRRYVACSSHSMGDARLTKCTNGMQKERKCEEVRDVKIVSDVVQSLTQHLSSAPNKSKNINHIDKTAVNK
jgi:dTDP-D-glucose 4,6-dehydratase